MPGDMFNFSAGPRWGTFAGLTANDFVDSFAGYPGAHNDRLPPQIRESGHELASLLSTQPTALETLLSKAPVDAKTFGQWLGFTVNNVLNLAHVVLAHKMPHIFARLPMTGFRPVQEDRRTFVADLDRLLEANALAPSLRPIARQLRAAMAHDFGKQLPDAKKRAVIDALAKVYSKVTPLSAPGITQIDLWAYPTTPIGGDFERMSRGFYCDPVKKQWTQARLST